MRKLTVINLIKIIILLLRIENLTCLQYPSVRRDSSIVDDYHGVPISDPYQWLEDLNSAETIDFVSQQNDLFSDYFDDTELEEIKGKLTALVHYPRSGALIKKGNRYFHFHNSGLQSHDVLWKQEDLTSPPSILLDPNTFSEDGSVSLYPYYYGFSEDASHFVYSLSQKGSDWLEGRIRNVQSGIDLEDILNFIKWPEFSFTNDGSGIFYSRFPLDEEGNPKTTNPQIYFHALGTLQEQDIFVTELSDYPEWFLFAEVSHCGNYLVLKPQPDFATNSILIASLMGFPSEELEFIPVKKAIVDQARFIYVTNTETKFIFLSDKDAPNFQLISVDVNFQTGEIGDTNILVPVNNSAVLKWARPFNQDFVVLCYFVDVKHELKLHSLNTGAFIQNINLPFIGVISDFHISKENDEFFFKIENLVTPGTIMKCLVNNSGGLDCDIFESLSLPGIDQSDFEMTQEFFRSKDGTRIPLFLAKRKILPSIGTNPTLLFGYAGFNVDLLPTFSPFTFAFVNLFKGIYAQANIRGGAEYGEKWHSEGSLLNKQNSFDDFQYAAEHLIHSGYTTPKKLAIQGSSNGGLLVATCVNQAPSLFAVALPDVPLTDMLRFQKSSIGFAWCSEYGCSDNLTHFQNLVRYSPLHNIKFPSVVNETEYPSILVSTGDNDERVLPFHSYKYIAELQHTIGRHLNQTNPILLQVTKDAGHSGENKPLPQLIEDYTKSFAFINRTFSKARDGDNVSGGNSFMKFQNFPLFFYFTILTIISRM